MWVWVLLCWNPCKCNCYIRILKYGHNILVINHYTIDSSLCVVLKRNKYFRLSASDHFLCFICAEYRSQSNNYRLLHARDDWLWPPEESEGTIPFGTNSMLWSLWFDLMYVLGTLVSSWKGISCHNLSGATIYATICSTWIYKKKQKKNIGVC